MKTAGAFFIVCLFTNSLYATILYTEVNEQVYTNSPRSYDLDLDGDADFNFTAVDAVPSTGTASFYVIAAKPTSFYAAESSGGERPKAYAEGAALGLHTFVSDTGLLASGNDGNFRNTTKYLTVKFSDGTNTYYGWILLQRSGFSHLQVISYAYSNIPDDTLLAGQTEPPTGVQEIDNTSFDLAAFTGQSISFKNCAAYDKVLVYTVEGKMIAEIHNPVAFRNYPITRADHQLLVAFFREDKLLYTTKRFLN